MGNPKLSPIKTWTEMTKIEHRHIDDSDFRDTMEFKNFVKRIKDAITVTDGQDPRNVALNTRQLKALVGDHFNVLDAIDLIDSVVELGVAPVRYFRDPSRFPRLLEESLTADEKRSLWSSGQLGAAFFADRFGT